MSKVTIGNAFSSVGYKPNIDSDDPLARRLTAFAEPGDEVEMPDSEAKRLEELGALEGGSADESEDAGVTTPYSKSPDEPSVDPGKPGDAQFAGTPIDREVLDDPRTDDEGAGDTASLALSDLKVRDNTLYAEAERLGLDVDEDETAAQLRSRIAEARDAQSSDDS